MAPLLWQKMVADPICSIELDQREHLSILSCINVDGSCISNFYILKGSYFLENYVTRFEKGPIMAMQPNA